MYKAVKLSTIYEELSAIIVMDLKSELYLLLSNDPFKRGLMGYGLYRDVKALEMV